MVRWVFSTAAVMRLSIRLWELSLPRSAATPSWCSTCWCAPCFAAIGAIKREMNNAKWTWFAIGYQCGFAYLCALMVNQFGKAFTGSLNVIGLVAAIAALAFIIYMLVRPYKEATKLSAKV